MRTVPSDLVTFVRLCGVQVNSQLRYRSDFVVGAFGKLLESSTRFFGLLLLLNAVQDLDGWTPAEIAIMQGFVMVGAGSSMFLNVFWDLWVDLRWGDFTQFMVRPFSPLLTYSAHGFDISGVFAPISGVVLIAVASRIADVPWTAWNFIVLLVGIASTVLVTSGLQLIAGSTSFWSWSMAGMRIEGSVRTIAPFPLSVFSPPLEFALKYVVPVGFVAFVPVDALVTDGVGISGPVVGVLIGALLCAVGATMFAFGARHHVATAS